jgi:hypothetical protein
LRRSGLPELKLRESDANSGATYTVFADGTGKQVATFTGSSASPLPVTRTFTNVTVPPTGASRAVTVTDSVGGSETSAAGHDNGCAG